MPETITDTSFAARDGYELAATAFVPSRPLRAAVVLNSATAVPRRIYRGFATYLAQRDFAVLTYDYRGVADSRPPKLAGFPARMRDWVRSMPALRSIACESFGRGCRYARSDIRSAGTPSAFLRTTPQSHARC
jgi:predicted alpha/beta hydrolase